jgi:hypothetical protein
MPNGCYLAWSLINLAAAGKLLILEQAISLPRKNLAQESAMVRTRRGFMGKGKFR